MIAGRISTASTFVRMAYRAGRLLRGQLHHLIPRYLVKVLGKSSSIVAALPQRLHQAYHNFVSRGMKEALGCPLMNARKAEWTKWIQKLTLQGIPEHVIHQRVRQKLRDLTMQFEQTYDVKGLSKALDEALK